MKLYENKRETTLKEALVVLFTNNVPGHNFEYMVSLEDGAKLVAFGKTWTKKDTSNWGKEVCRYWIHEENCPTIAYDDVDWFVSDLLHIPGMKRHFNKKKFHIWEEI